MVSKKSKRRKQRQWAQRQARECLEQSRGRYFNQTFASENSKELWHNEFQRYIVEKEKDLLSRTVFVTKVRDLNKSANLQGLRNFFESHYGPVEDCRKSFFQRGKMKNKSLRYPPGRVTFRYKGDAEKSFGKKLLTVRNSLEVPCPLGHPGGNIRVGRSELYDDMLRNEMTGSIMEIQGQSFALGHWFAADQEIVTGENYKTNQWVQVKKCAVPKIIVDIRKRKIFLMALA